VPIAGHNAWEFDWPVLLTFPGSAMTIKCAAYLSVPGLVENSVERKAATTPRSYQIVGATMDIVGAILAWHARARQTRNEPSQNGRATRRASYP
jgi:hypothetical protein